MNGIQVNWSNFKEFCQNRYISMQYVLLDNTYYLLAFDGPFEITCILPKDSSADCLDFEQNFLPTSNKILEQRDSNGAILARTKITETGWSYQLIGMEIETSTVNGAYCKDSEGNILPWLTYKLYDSTGVETTNELLAVKTIVDFEPPFDYEIIGGFVRQKTLPITDVYYSVIGVPDIPSQYGGSRVFIQSVDLTYISPNNELRIDGKTPKRLYYNSTNHTNKIRFQILHDPGVKHKFLQCLEYFRP